MVLVYRTFGFISHPSFAFSRSQFVLITTLFSLATVSSRTQNPISVYASQFLSARIVIVPLYLNTHLRL